MSKEKNEIAADDKPGSFPSETLSFCRELVSQVVKRKGDTTVSFKEIAIILGRPAGPLSLPVSSCVQYGLFKNIFSKGYNATELFNRIEMPVYESDRSNAILEALSKPLLYKTIIEEFNGKILPDEQGMSNYLVKKFGIKSYIINKVITTFFKNFREFDLVDSNNRLRFLTPSPTEKQKGTGDAGELKETPPPPPPPPAFAVGGKMFDQAIDLGGEDAAHLVYPRNITPLQTAMLRIHLEATLTALEARHKLKNSEPKETE